MEPIVLTEFGDTLLQRGNKTDDSPISPSHPLVYHSSVCRIGIHDFCGGDLKVKKISKTHNVIFCNSCGLRVPLPQEIETYGDLRSHIAGR